MTSNGVSDFKIFLNMHDKVVPCLFKPQKKYVVEYMYLMYKSYIKNNAICAIGESILLLTQDC